MKSLRKTAVIVGGLFIIALVFDIIGRGIYEPIIKAPDFLDITYPNKLKVIVGILFEFICAPAILLIPIVLFPIFRKVNESLALGYVGFRALEGILFIYMVINSLSIISLSQSYLNDTVINTSYLITLGHSIHSQLEWTTLIYIIVFTLGALMFYSLLFRSKLLPRFISIWGLIAASILLVFAVLGMLYVIPVANAMMYGGSLIALNEITLSIWLIIKGFNQPPIIPESK